MLRIQRKALPFWKFAVSLLMICASSCNPDSDAVKNSAEVAEACGESDLIAQCPPNSFPDLEARASIACNQAGSINASQSTMSREGSATVDTACVGEGECQVVCRLEIPCQYGVERISPDEGILCAPPPAGCGNGICDAGESPESCSIDCGTDCEPRIKRCVGDQIQTCTPRGVWDDAIDCATGSRCTLVDDQAICRAASCGDGLLDIGEECDPNSDDEVECDMNCTRPRCGNGVVGRDANGVEEACDDGNMDNDDGCTNSCELAGCGDGIVGTGEECDDGNQEDGDGCTNACLLARCGDGSVQVGVEECDDGNQVDDDDCTNLCTVPRCGDSVTQAGETCDDGNQVNDDACLNTCELASCGDGVVYSSEEECDDQNSDDTDACLSNCQFATCGDGERRADLTPGEEGFEYCDDGDDDEFDGCNSGCFQTEVEPNDSAIRGGGDVILYDKIVGILERAPSGNSAGTDTFLFEVDCGVGQGSCPPDAQVTWSFSLTTLDEVCKEYMRSFDCGGCQLCVDRGVSVSVCNNMACSALPTAPVWIRSDRGLEATWSVTVDLDGPWQMQLRNSHTEAFSYTLAVTEVDQ